MVRTAGGGLYHGNRQPEAETILNEALKKNPSDLEALLQRSQIYFRQRIFEAALADLDKALIVSPASPQAHYLRSKIFLVRGDQMRRIQDLYATLRTVPVLCPPATWLMRCAG